MSCEEGRFICPSQRFSLYFGLLRFSFLRTNFQRGFHSSIAKANTKENAGMTTSKRVAEKKVAKFQKNITKRGSVSESTPKKGRDYPVAPILIGFFVFVVIGSSLFQIIRTATSGGMA